MGCRCAPPIFLRRHGRMIFWMEEEYCDVCGDYNLYPRVGEPDVYECEQCHRVVRKHIVWLDVEEEKPA